MAVAVLCVGRGARRILGVSALRVVLVRNVLCKIWRDHFADFLGFLLVQIFGAIAVSVPGALRQALVVVAVHQRGVVVARRRCVVVGGHCGRRLDSPGGSPSF
jgi:hypothetical protein